MLQSHQSQSSTLSNLFKFRKLDLNAFLIPAQLLCTAPWKLKNDNGAQWSTTPEDPLSATAALRSTLNGFHAVILMVVMSHVCLAAMRLGTTEGTCSGDHLASMPILGMASHHMHCWGLWKLADYNQEKADTTHGSYQAQLAQALQNRHVPEQE